MKERALMLMRKISLFLLPFLMAGCVTTPQLDVGLSGQVGMSKENALAVLQDAKEKSRRTYFCSYTDTGIIGRYSQIIPGDTKVIPFDQWKVDAVAVVALMADDALVVSIGTDGGLCAPLRSPRRNSGPMTEAEKAYMEQVVSALVTLGVQYDPVRLGVK